MKRLLMAVLILLPVFAFADNVKVDKALETAQRFLGAGATKAGGSTLQLVWRGEQKGETPMAQPAYYVFNIDGGGFVIVAGEDSVKPILAYSYEGSFKTEGMPDNLAYWMDSQKESILYLREHGVKASPAMVRLWQNPADMAPNPARADYTLTTANWAQDGLFGAKCPMVDGYQSVVGCVPTATAIIMRYHKHPEKGSGTLPGYQYKTAKNNTRTQEGHALTAKYNWDNMPLTYSGGESADKKDAVATLMFDLAVMVFAQFNSADNGGTSSRSADARSGLINYMGYDPGIKRTQRGYMSNDVWLNMIETEIDEERPLLYEGKDPGGYSHVFVVDGYNDAGYIRCNWGWGGTANGFYSVDNLVPSGIPRNYSQDHVIYTGLKPRDSSEIALSYDRFSAYSLTSEAGATFKTKAFDVKALGGTFNGFYAVGRFNKDGDFQDIVSENVKIQNLAPGAKMDQEATVTVPDMIYPDDEIRPCYSADGTTWKRMYFDASQGGKESQVLGGGEILTDRTDFEYDAQQGKITITTLPIATWTFKTGGGTDKKAMVSADNGVLTIYTSTLEAGRYVLTLTVGDYSKTLAFTL